MKSETFTILKPEGGIVAQESLCHCPVENIRNGVGVCSPASPQERNVQFCFVFFSLGFC